MDSPERIETEASGGCQCGAVRWHVTAVLDTSHICHCRMCQKASGQPFMALTGGNKLTRNLVSMDNPDHKHFRAMTQGYFSPKHMKRKCPGSITPAWIGPTPTSCTSCPRTWKNG